MRLSSSFSLSFSHWNPTLHVGKGKSTGRNTTHGQFKVDVNTDDSLLRTLFTSFNRCIQEDTRSQPRSSISMDYLTDGLQGPMYYSPYAGYQSSFTPQSTNELDALLAVGIIRSIYIWPFSDLFLRVLDSQLLVHNTITLRRWHWNVYHRSITMMVKIPPSTKSQVDWPFHSSELENQLSPLYLVEQTPIDSILRQFGIDLHTLQPSDSSRNYFKSR